MTIPSPKIIIGALAILFGGGAVILIANVGTSHQGTPTTQIELMPPPPEVHTANWYVAHPNVLKADEQRCAGDAARIPQVACQNAAAADAQLSAAEYANAAAALSSAPNGRPSTLKTP
jgi:hypothetical protein